MRVLGQVVMLFCFTVTGLIGLGLLFVFPPLGIFLLIMVFMGWSSWAARKGVEGLTQAQQTLNRIEANTRKH